MKSIYLDKLPELEEGFHKEAGFVARLSDSPENWPVEVESELFKQLPFLTDYDVTVNLEKVDAQRGYAFGYADLANQTERPEVEHEEAGLPHIRIPLVIIDRAVKPFTVFLDGERTLPLTEDRIREILFNPTTFDLSTTGPNNPSLANGSTPPNRSGPNALEKTSGWKDIAKHPATTGAAGLAAGAVGGHHFGRKKGQKEGVVAGARYGYSLGKAEKEREKKSSILRAIADTIDESQKAEFIEKVAEDRTLQAGFKRSGLGSLLVDVFDRTKTASAEDRFRAIAEKVEPSVVSIMRLPGGDFLVKQANTNAFMGGDPAQGQVVPEEEVAGAIGPDQAQAMQPGQSVTAVSDPVDPSGLSGPAPSKAKPVEMFGEYMVQDEMGNQIMGFVFPELLAWDGNFTPQPMMLFTNGSAYAVQDVIIGELIGKGGTVLPKDTPRGDGVFYSTAEGEPICTAPITVRSSVVGPEGYPQFVGQDLMGMQVSVSIQPGLTQPMRVSDAEFALPETWKFMRLNNQTQLVSDPTQQVKTAAIQGVKSSARILYNGSFTVEGMCGLEKVARDLRTDLDAFGTEFLLGVLGVDGHTAKQKIAEARRKGVVKLAGLRTITTLGERYRESVKTASAFATKVPQLRKDLVKVAAVMDDESTADHILALNFLNTENLATFVEYLPELELTSERLAEMLLSCYLGMTEVPEGAVERAMKNLEEVIVGLKAVQSAEA